MPRFSDSAGEGWTIEISVHEIRVLRSQLSVDLLAIMDDNGALLRRLANDPITLVDVISVLCTDQITTRKLTDVQFAHRLKGEGLANALDCLIEAIANFTPPQRGALINQAWAKVKEMDQRAMTKMAAKLESPELNRQLDAKMEALLNEAGS